MITRTRLLTLVFCLLLGTHAQAATLLVANKSDLVRSRIVAEEGDKWYQGEIKDAVAHHPNLTVESMPGPHHIHLEPAYVEQVAKFTRQFLNLGN